MTYDPLPWTRIATAAAPQFSADGRTLFHLRGQHAEAWALDLGSGDTRRLAASGERLTTLRRAPQDDRLILAHDRGGDERAQLLLFEDGTARPLTRDETAIHSFGAWSPDGTRISFASNDEDVARFTLYTMDVAAGVRTRLLDVPGELAPGAWHPDGARLLAIHERATGDERLLIVDAATGAAHEVPRRGATRYQAARWTPDGRLLAITDAHGGDVLALCALDETTGAAETLHAPQDRDIDVWSLAPGTGSLATIENDRGWSVLRVGPPGGERPVVAGLPRGVLSDLAWSPDGQRLALVASAPMTPASLWVVESGAARPVWRPEMPAGLAPVEPELVEWTAQDGKAVPGWLTLPRGDTPASGWPAIIWVHGGPAAQTRPVFRPDMQALLGQGYAVLMPNVRGSTGYGRAAMESDDIENRLDAVEDLVAGARWLAARPEIDAGRLAVMGQSYGGYMVLAAITEHPALWRTAIDFYGVADFETLLADTGPWRRAHRAAEYGDPVRHRALFDRISPLKHAGRIAVPLLVLHGIRDPRVPFSQSEAMVQALTPRRHDVRFERFEYAGHGFVRSEDRERVYAAVAEFLAETL